MNYNQQIHYRRPIRLKDYDYTQTGAYFVTIVTQHRACLFGEVVDGGMRLNSYGAAVLGAWRDLPNHVHKIVVLMTDDVRTVGAGFKPAPTHAHGLPEIIRAFKTFSARRINASRTALISRRW